MSQQVAVDKTLVFKGDAAQAPNIEGDMLPERMNSIDWYDQTAIDLTNDYSSLLDGSDDAVALTAGGENGVKLTTGTGDQEVSFLATGLIFDFTQRPAIATKIEITDVSGTFVFWGFSDAVSEATPIATIDAAGGTLAAGANDAVGFVIDADLGASTIYCASVKGGAAVQSVNTGIVWANGD